MKHLFLLLRRVLIVFLVGTFISVSTFRGEAIADGEETPVIPFINVCTLQRETPSVNQPAFQNPQFADADQGLVTLRATQDKFTLQGNGKGNIEYDGYIYGATYTDRSGATIDNNLQPTYTPPVIEVSPSEEVDGKQIDNYLNVNLINDLPVNVQLAGELPQTKENLESVSQYTNIHYHGFNVSPLLGGDDVLVAVPSNVTPKPEEITGAIDSPGNPINVQGNSDVVYYNTNGQAVSATTDKPYKLIPVPPLGDITPESTDISEGNLPGGYYPDYNPSANPPASYTSGPITDYNMGFLIPDIHQSGLFWYHSHAHSLSDNQVRGGLSGAIIIKGNDEYYEQFLKPVAPPPIQLPTAREALESTFLNEYEANSLTPEITQQVMTFKDFNNVLGSQEDCFVLNSQVNPEIKIKPGEIQLWRIANIGADNYMNIALETLSEPNDGKQIIGSASFEDGIISDSSDGANGSISGSINSLTIGADSNTVEGSFQVEKTDGNTQITQEITISNATVSDFEEVDSRLKTVSFTITGDISGQDEEGNDLSGTIVASVTGTIGTIPEFTQPYGNSNFYILARDSDVVANPVATNSVLLPPASRAELLVVGGEPGTTYNLVSDLQTKLTKKQQQWLNPNLNTSYVLATVSVDGSTVESYIYTDAEKVQSTVSVCDSPTTNQYCSDGTTINLDYFIKNQKPYKIDEILPEPEDIAKLRDDEFCTDLYQLSNQKLNPIEEKILGLLKSYCITPPNAYPNEPLTDERQFTFKAINRGAKFVVNDKLYDGNRIDKVSHVGDIEEWDLVNPTGFPHVFHIHQLDFLVTKVKLNYDPCATLDNEGICTYNNYVVKGNSCDDEGQGSQNTEGRYLCELETQGYRDVFNLPSHSTTTVRIPFVNPFITGIFVYHCHILAHEDLGMMQNLKVINPEGFREDQLINLKNWLHKWKGVGLERLSKDQLTEFKNWEWLSNWKDINPEGLSKDQLRNLKRRLDNWEKKVKNRVNSDN